VPDRPTDIKNTSKLIDAKQLQIFLCLQTKGTEFFLSKKREEVELLQGTLEVLKNVRNWISSAIETNGRKNCLIRDEKDCILHWQFST
jgi:hypothetical protein